MSSIETRSNRRTGETTWRVRYRHEGRNKSVSFTSHEAARLWQVQLDSLGHDAARALLGEEKPKVIRTTTAQVRHHVRHLTGVTEGTRRKYETIIDTHLNTPPLSTVLVTDLTRDHVRAWVNKQKGSPKSIKNRHSLLSSALSSAERDGLILSNVAKGVRLPRADGGRVEMEFLTAGDFGKVLREIDPFWWPVPLLLAGTGLRWGEATALTVGDVDLDAGEARVHQAWKATGSRARELGPPKTRRSRRTVALSAPAVTAIEGRCRSAGRDEFVLVSRQGRVVLDWWRERIWKPAVARALKGRKVRVHDLRHTYASWAIQDGMPLPVLQRQLGHESIQTTVDTYGHLVRADFAVLAESNGVRLSEALSVAGPPVVAGEILP